MREKLVMIKNVIVNITFFGGIILFILYMTGMMGGVILHMLFSPRISFEQAFFASLGLYFVLGIIFSLFLGYQVKHQTKEKEILS